MNKIERYTYITDYFRREMPEAASELNFRNPFELLVAVILSAQCTDKRVNLVTPALFDVYPDAKSMAQADISGIYEKIKSISYPNNKARNLKGMAETLTERFQGKVPDNMEELLLLPGVGRKTANVILAVNFHKPAMAVDTHVFRVADRIGLSTHAKTPLETEKQLLAHFDETDIPEAHHWLLLHGRYVCTARNPRCEACGIKDACRYFETRKKEQ